jgi:hypothetical protein
MPADARVSSSVRYLPQPTRKKRLLNGDDMICNGNLYATASKVGKNISLPLRAARISHNRRIIWGLQKYTGEPEAATTCCRTHRQRQIAHKTVQFVTKPGQ